MRRSQTDTDAGIPKLQCRPRPTRKDNTPGINNQAFCPKIAKGHKKQCDSTP